jgi:hypothetical protein
MLGPMLQNGPGRAPERRPEPKFPLGRCVATPRALRAVAAAGVEPGALLARHVTGDWGELDEQDRAENERSLREGHRLLSAYPLPSGVKVWVITEYDRSVTTLLLPEEY